jgi:hypothetical protein
VYQRGRGHEPVTVAGSIRSLVAVKVIWPLLLVVGEPILCVLVLEFQALRRLRRWLPAACLTSRRARGSSHIVAPWVRLAGA